MPEARPEQIENLMENAEEFACTLSAAAMAEKRKLLLEIVNGVQVRLNRIRIEIVTGGLLDVLGHPDQSDATERIVTIDIPVKLRRRGVEKKIVITDRNRRPARPDANLIKAIAEGRLWFDQLKSGKVRMAKEIAARNRTDFGNVTRTMQLAFLAPDIIEAILEGRQPPHLTAFHLKRVRNLPLSWAEQRKMLGFAG